MVNPNAGETTNEKKGRLAKRGTALPHTSLKKDTRRNGKEDPWRRKGSTSMDRGKKSKLEGTRPEKTTKNSRLSRKKKQKKNELRIKWRSCYRLNKGSDAFHPWKKKSAQLHEETPKVRKKQLHESDRVLAKVAHKKPRLEQA